MDTRRDPGPSFWTRLGRLLRRVSAWVDRQTRMDLRFKDEAHRQAFLARQREIADVDHDDVSGLAGR